MTVWDILESRDIYKNILQILCFTQLHVRYKLFVLFSTYLYLFKFFAESKGFSTVLNRATLIYASVTY